MTAIRVHRTGGPEVLKYEEVPYPSQVQKRHGFKIEAVGLNFVDTYQRSGLYPLKVPFTQGWKGPGS